jgi:hypothetical protein
VIIDCDLVPLRDPMGGHFELYCTRRTTIRYSSVDALSIVEENGKLLLHKPALIPSTSALDLYI